MKCFQNQQSINHARVCCVDLKKRNHAKVCCVHFKERQRNCENCKQYEKENQEVRWLLFIFGYFSDNAWFILPSIIE